MESERVERCSECDAECGQCEECARLSYCRNFSESMKQMRDEGLLCDARLRAKCGFELLVHSCMISAVSPVIKEMLFNGEAEEEERVTVTLTEVGNEQILRCLVDFAYTGRVHLTQENVKSVLQASKMYVISDLIPICCDFIVKNLTVENCISFMYAAKRLGLEVLELAARRFVLWNFFEVYKTNKDFTELLTEDDLSSLLGDDYLNVPDETEVLKAVTKWVVGGEIEARSSAFSNLFNKLRLGLCFKPHLDICSSEGLCELGQTDPNFFRSRVPRNLLFCFGGWSNGHATCDVEVFDVKAGLWIIPQIRDKYARAYHGLAVLGCDVFVIGGYDGVQCLRSVRSFNAVMGAWHERNAMAEGRCYVTAVVLENRIYAIGGFGGIDRKSSCEKFDPKTNQWSNISPMNQARSDGSAAVYSGKIIVCGGYSGQEVLSSSEIYDPETDQWTLFSRLPGPRSGHALFWFNQSLYLVGGHNGNSRLNDVYRYSFLQERWIEEAPLNKGRSNFGIAELERKLYVIGGYDGRNVLSSVECYDPEAKSWSSVTNLNFPRSASGACTMGDLPNAKRYSANGPFGKNRYKQ